MINKVTQSTHFFAAKIENQNSKNNDLFKQTLDKALDSQGASKMQTTSSLSEIPPTQYTMAGPSSSIEDKTDKLINMLDYYSTQLQSPETSLKTIEPVLEEIKTSAGKLLKETESAPDTNDELKKIAMECAITANNEYVKFQRGDYI